MKFMSKCENQILCMQPTTQQVTNGYVLTVPGKHIRFSNGEFDAETQEEIEFIKNHALYGTKIVDATKKKGE